MNCKPHDLAQIMSNFSDNRNAIGMIVRLSGRTFIHPRSGVIGWYLQEVLVVERDDGVKGNEYIKGISDKCLRPIRDPGDDAVDEMVLRVGAPDKVAA